MLSFIRCLTLTALALFLSACATGSKSSSELTRFEFERPEMGMPFRIVLYAPNQATAEAAANKAYARAKELNAILSDYEPDSEVSRLSVSSQMPREVPVSDDLWNVLWPAQRLAAKSGGAFDITVGPCTTLWRRARRDGQFPTSQRLDKALAATGFHKLELDKRSQTARLTVPNMRLDLGAIAKGYIIDETMKVLRKEGITRAMVGGGGDTAFGDPPPGRKGWRVEVSALDTPDAPPARYLLLANRAVATSGDLYQRVEIDGVRYSHIVNPITGIGLTDHGLVRVIAKDCITADSLATAVSVLGPDKGLKLIESTSGTSAYIARKPGEEIEVRESKNFTQFYELSH